MAGDVTADTRIRSKTPADARISEAYSACVKALPEGYLRDQVLNAAEAARNVGLPPGVRIEKVRSYLVRAIDYVSRAPCTPADRDSVLGFFREADTILRDGVSASYDFKLPSRVAASIFSGLEEKIANLNGNGSHNPVPSLPKAPPADAIPLNKVSAPPAPAAAPPAKPPAPNPIVYETSPFDLLNKQIFGFKQHDDLSFLRAVLKDHKRNMFQQELGRTHRLAAEVACKNLENLVLKSYELSRTDHNFADYVHKNPSALRYLLSGNGTDDEVFFDDAGKRVYVDSNLVDMHLGHWLRSMVGSLTKYVNGTGRQYAPQVNDWLLRNKEVWQRIVKLSADIARERVEGKEMYVTLRNHKYKRHVREEISDWTELEHLPNVSKKQIVASVETESGRKYSLSGREVREAYDAAVITCNALKAANYTSPDLQQVFDLELKHRLSVAVSGETVVRMRADGKPEGRSDFYEMKARKFAEKAAAIGWRRFFSKDARREYESNLEQESYNMERARQATPARGPSPRVVKESYDPAPVSGVPRNNEYSTQHMIEGHRHVKAAMSLGWWGKYAWGTEAHRKYLAHIDAAKTNFEEISRVNPEAKRFYDALQKGDLKAFEPFVTGI